MTKKVHHIDIEIDKLINSIENAFSGDSFDTELIPIIKDDLRPIKKGNGWQFDWKYEFEQPERLVYKLTIKGNLNVIQGLISFSDEKTLGAVHVGNHKMVIFPKEALQLIKKYFKV